ncbi:MULTISPECIES: hypothetical protein [unclassified Streptomyces]|uniref:hypothetical protein n=1 Tax=unclassified Streptomyces TaxID=2593676 RepID=UPI00380EC60B
MKMGTGIVLALAAAVITATATAAPRRALSTGSVSLTNADNGRTVVVRAGDEIRVRLTGGRGQGVTWVWSEPVTSAPATLRRTRGATSPNGDATAVFLAVKNGESDITSARRCVPNPGSLCSQAVLQWKVTVDVR